MSLLAPFFLKDGRRETEILSKIKEVVIIPFKARFSSLGLFEQRERKFLHALIEPADECGELAQRLSVALEVMIEIDTSPYTNGVIPSFEAHVTLDYNFEGEIPKTVPEVEFVVEKVAVFKGENGEWVECKF